MNRYLAIAILVILAVVYFLYVRYVRPKVRRKTGQFINADAMNMSDEQSKPLRMEASVQAAAMLSAIIAAIPVDQKVKLGYSTWHLLGQTTPTPGSVLLTYGLGGSKRLNNVDTVTIQVDGTPTGCVVVQRVTKWTTSNGVPVGLNYVVDLRKLVISTVRSLDPAAVPVV